MSGFNYTKSLLSREYDPAEVFYMVDSDYRTVVQGWAQPDGSGPLDLWQARNPGRVYRTGDFSTDAVTLQAGIDAMVDFRGDALFFTPGAYTIATVRTVDVPDARWLGPKVSHPSLARASITASVDLVFPPTAAADRMEIGYLQLVPLTAGTMFDVAAVTGFHGHDLFLNWDGIAASTGTVGFVFATASEFINFEKIYAWVDGAQGPLIRTAGIVKGLSIKDFELYLEAGTWAVAFNLAGVGQADFNIGPGTMSGAGTALTSLITMADKTVNTVHGFVHNVRCATSGPAAGSLAVATGLAAEISIVDCWRAVDTDAAQPTFTSGGAISWESGVPYTG